MSIHAVNHQQALISPIEPAASAASKPATSTSFSQILGTYLPAKTSGAPVATTTAPAEDTGFAALFSNYNPAATTVKGNDTGSPVTPTPPFTATYVTGATVTNPDGSQTALNPMELATASTAAEVAQLLGGTVVNSTMGGNFTDSAPTREISVPGSSNEINAGLAANLFSQYGTAAGSQAWVTIDQDLGIG